MKPGPGANASPAGVAGAPRVVVMLPAYNEEQDLPPLLQRLQAALAPWADYRVLVVDDGSVDRTALVVLEAARHMPVRLLQHRRNKGLGVAMRSGLEAASVRGDIVVTLDADNSQDPALIRRMVQQVQAGCDVVIASRFRPGAQEVGVPPLRKALSHIASACLRRLAPYEGVRDYTCGFRAYRAELLRGMLAAHGSAFVRQRGFACMLEILLNLRRVNARVGEVPLVLRYDLKAGASKMRVLRTVWQYGSTLLRARLPLPVLEDPPSSLPAAVPLAAAQRWPAVPGLAQAGAAARARGTRPAVPGASP
jgi:dolichol-phosphate mannosyltransferase